jgi:hypothetical protein
MPRTARSASRAVKTTLNLPPESAELLRNLADQRQTTLTEVIRRALQLEDYLTKIRDGGGRIYVETEDESNASSKTEVVIF